MTKEERKALLRRLMRASQAKGWAGGVDPAKASEFAEWAEDENMEFAEQKSGKLIDLKALVVEQPDSATVVITEVDDEAPVDDANEMEDEPEEEEKRSASKLARQVKQFRADAELMRTQIAELQKRARTPAVQVKSAEEIRYEDRAKKGQTAFRSLDNAKGFGHVLKIVGYKSRGDMEAAQGERKRLLEHLERMGIDAKAYATTPATSGGALVPEQFLPDIINNVEEFGIARRLAKVVTMTSDKLTRPRKTGLLEVYYPDEGGTISEDQVDWDNVTLAAKMGAVITRASRQILDDAAIDLLDDAAKEMARAIAYVEDNTLFFGDGTTGTDNEYIPGVEGIISQIGTGASNAQRIQGGGTASAHTGAQLATWVGLLPAYARQGAVIVTSAQLNSIIFDRLAINDVGGLTQQEYEAGMIGRYRGIPILPSQVMPTTDDAGAARVDALVGDFSRAAMLGDRMSLELATSDQRYFDTAQIAIRGLIRHDINVHDLGTTAVSGPVVALSQS